MPYDAPQGVTWESSDENVASVDKNGKITANLAGVTTISVNANGKIEEFVLNVCQKLTGADLYITDNNIKNTILNCKTFYDNVQNQYLSGVITEEQRKTVQNELLYTAELARADYIVVNDQSEFAYQYFKGRKQQDSDYCFPFNRTLTLGDTGIEVMIIQRAMQVIGWFEPDANFVYGVFDEATYTAALNAPWLVLSSDGTFDGASYLSVFQASTAEFRQPQWLINLQEYSAQHKIVQIDFAKRANAQIEVGIRNGGPSGNHYGYADVLAKGNDMSQIWEMKHYNPNILSNAKKQLDRYMLAANDDSTPQEFPTPLIAGYDIDTYYIAYGVDSALEVSSSSIKGIVFYREVPISSIPNGKIPEFVVFPESEKEYEFQLKPITLENAVDGILETCMIIALAGELYLFINGVYVPIVEVMCKLNQYA